MTDRLEEALNLSHYNEENEDNKKISVENDSEKQLTTDEDLSMSDKIDQALVHISDLQDHDLEMDEIAEEALNAYKDFKKLGLNVTDAHAGKILEVASNMLKIAADSKNSKNERRLKMLELQIKKEKVDLSKTEQKKSPNGIHFDRNELLKSLRDEAGGDSQDSSDEHKTNDEIEVDPVEVDEENRNNNETDK